MTLALIAARPQAGGNVIDDSNPAAPLVYLKRPGEYAGWDLSGRTIYIDVTGRYSFTNCKFGPYPNPPTRGSYSPALAIGLNDDPQTPRFVPEIIATHCLFDGRCTGWNSILIAQQTGRVNVQRSRFTNGSGAYVTSGSKASGTTLILIENAFDSPGYNASSVKGESHCEVVHISAGSVVVSRNLMDARDGPNRLDYVMTGFALIQARTAPIVATFEHNVMIGSGPVRMPYVLQIDANVYGVTATVKDNVMEPGIYGGYIAASPGKGLTLVKSGNVDFKSGAAAER